MGGTWNLGWAACADARSSWQWIYDQPEVP